MYGDKIYGNEKTSLNLSDKAYGAYVNCDPCTIVEHEDGTYSIHGIIEQDGMTAEDVNRFFEDEADLAD